MTTTEGVKRYLVETFDIKPSEAQRIITRLRDIVPLFKDKNILMDNVKEYVEGVKKNFQDGYEE